MDGGEWAERVHVPFGRLDSTQIKSFDHRVGVIILDLIHDCIGK